MEKFCDNPGCSAYRSPQQGRHCAYCGEPLVSDEPSGSSVSKVSTGADGISVSRVSNDSHDTISNNNTTIVLNGKSIEDLTIKDRKASYRKYCSEIIKNGIITPATRKQLDEYALELDLPKDDLLEIERFVKKHSSESGYELSAFDRDNLDIIRSYVSSNQGNLNDMLAKLEAMSTYDNDEVQFYYNMIQCVSSPSTIIRKYDDRTQDNYWQSFWTYVAFLKNGQKVRAEKTLRELTAWDMQSQDNLWLLQSVGALIDDDIDTASVFISKTRNTSFLLESLAQTSLYLIKYRGQRKLSNSSVINFYIEKIFGLKQGKAPHPVAANATPSQVINTNIKPLKTPPPIQPVSVGGHNKSFWGRSYFIAIAAIVIVAILLIPKMKNKEEKPAVAVAQPVVQSASTEVKDNTVNNKPVTQSVGSSTAKRAESKKEDSATQPKVVSKPATTETTPTSTTTVSKDEATFVATAKPVSDPIAELKASADSGNKDAQFALGMRYYEGNGVPKNMSTAFSYLRPLAEAGYVRAYFPVADMYHRGQGVAKDRDAAEKWYQKAADAGNSKAKNILINSF